MITTMTLAEIDDTLPNGFHDAEIEHLTWDFRENSVTLDMNFWVATEEDNREKRRRGKVELQRIMFISIDPPGPRHSDSRPYRPMSGPLQIDGVLTDEKIFPCLPKLILDLPSETEVFSFYVANWNSFIHIAAERATLVWSEGENYS